MTIVEGSQGGLTLGASLAFLRSERRVLLPFHRRTQGAALGPCSLKVGRFVETAEASRNDPGLHMPASGPWHPTPTTRGPDAGEMTLLEVNGSPVAG